MTPTDASVATPPYYRIIRPLYIHPSGDNYGHEHYFDSRYCPERQSLLHSYYIIMNDFKKLFDYIEFHEDNKKTFSHRIYELYLRSCTEFENNCKGILNSNGYQKTGNLNITDYFKINQSSKLNEYQVKINIWSPNALIVQPFAEWNSTNFAALPWYQDYNSVKHDRSSNFQLASLENLVKSMTGLFALLVSQFHYHAFQQFQMNIMSTTDSDNFTITQDSVFSIKLPRTWSESDTYNFDWNTQKASENPFRQYSF